MRVILGVGVLREYTLEGGRFAGERESVHVCARPCVRAPTCAFLSVCMCVGVDAGLGGTLRAHLSGRTLRRLVERLPLVVWQWSAYHK